VDLDHGNFFEFPDVGHGHLDVGKKTEKKKKRKIRRSHWGRSRATGPHQAQGRTPGRSAGVFKREKKKRKKKADEEW